MKLRSLALNQFKKFTNPVKLEGIQDGLNIIVGPNEMGKSTLLDALRAVLFEKYNSKAMPIKQLQNERNQAAPVVELEFELENGIHRIRKRFLKKPYARLYCPDGSTLEGDAAEETLRDLLNFSEPGKSAADPETLGMWHVLWVKQGQSFSAPDISTSAKTNLHSALESEVGTVLGGKRGRDLPQTIEKQLGELITKTGRSRGEYRAAEEHVNALGKKLRELKEKKENLSKDLRELEESQEKQKRLSDPKNDEEDRDQLNKALGQREELMKLENSVEREELELKVRVLTLERAKEKEEERRNLKDGIAQLKSQLSNFRKEHEELSEQERQTQVKLEGLKAKNKEAEITAEKADYDFSMKSLVLGAVEMKTEIGRLNARLEKARNAESRRTEAQSRAIAIAVTEEVIKRAEAAEKKMEKAAARLSATSTLITFEMENLSEIKVNGSPLASDENSLQSVSPVTITIPERGNILIEPGVENRDELLKQHAEAESHLKDILSEACALSVAEARNLHSKRQKALEEAEFAGKETELYAHATDEYKAGVQALADYIKELESRFESGMDKLPVKDLPELQEAKTILQEAEKKSETARNALKKTRASLSAPESVLENFRGELANIKARSEETEKNLGNLLNQLKGAEEECTENKLREDSEAAQKAVSDQGTEVARLRAKSSEGDSREQVELRIERLEKAAEKKRKIYQGLQEKVIGLKSRIDVLEGTGLDEDIEQTERQHEIREEERRRYEHEAQVLTLLLETLRNAEREAKELYLSPVTNRMRPYLELLFPDSEITINEDLRVTGVIREAGYEEPFPLLSMGTQEQIAVLVRLAFAEMLIEQGRPAAVVLDDALAFSDDTRMNRMFDIFTFASRKVQILILTCREQLFENIGGHSLSLQPGDPEELISA